MVVIAITTSFLVLCGINTNYRSWGSFIVSPRFPIAHNVQFTQKRCPNYERPYYVPDKLLRCRGLRSGPRRTSIATSGPRDPPRKASNPEPHCNPCEVVVSAFRSSVRPWEMCEDSKNL